MSNELINKYFDGELSQKETGMLHKLLVEDKSAKREFDIYSQVNNNIKSEKENILYPNGMFNDFEDSMMMKYLQEADDIIMPLPNKISALIFDYNYLKYAAAIIIMILSGVLTISELSIFQNSELFIQDVAQKIHTEKASPTSNPEMLSNDNSVAQNTNNNDITAVINKQEKSVNITQKSQTNKLDVNHQNIVASVIAPDSEFAVPHNKSVVNNTIENVEDRNENEIINIASVFADDSDIYSSSFSQLPIVTDVQLITDVQQMRLNNYIPYYEFDNEFFGRFNVYKINFISTVGVGMTSYGASLYDDSPVSLYSQSLGYEVSDKTSYGIEFGISEFSVARYTEIRIPTSIVVNSQGSGSSNDNVIMSKVIAEKRVQLIWSSFYYERILLHTDYTSIGSRIGFGLAGNMPLVSTKLFIKQKIFGSLYLTGGIENKTFQVDLDSENNRNYLSIFNILYGVQFDL